MSSLLKIAFLAIFTFLYNSPSKIVFFFKKKNKNVSELPKLQGEAHFQSGCCAFGATLTDVWWANKKKKVFLLCFVKIAGGFTFKVDYGKSSKIMFKLSVLWRRQNGVHQTSVSAVPNGKILKANFYLDKIWLFAIVKNNKFSNWRSSKYVVFPRRQPYFTYGDLHSSGLENHAFQLTIL